MARHPDWFAHLDTITEVLGQSSGLEWIGRKQIKAIFSCSERDSIRLLHKFGAVERDNALSLPRSALLAQLEAIRSGSTYAAFLSRRQNVVKQITAARTEAAARQFHATFRVPGDRQTRLQDLPKTITWRRTTSTEPGRFEILYQDGADLMWQLAEFLSAAGVSREEFAAGTEPSQGAV